MLDGEAVWLEDGDLLVFGTQRHSVPKMPAVTEGRVSVAIFWYPEEKAEAPQVDEGTLSCAGCGASEEVQEASDGAFYCCRCWQQWSVSQGISIAHSNVDEDDDLAAALQRSLVEY